MKKQFLDEIELMYEIGSHPNILTLLGCCTIEEPYLLLTEFMKYGDLLHFMWKSREVKFTIISFTKYLNLTSDFVSSILYNVHCTNLKYVASGFKRFLYCTSWSGPPRLLVDEWNSFCKMVSPSTSFETKQS